MTEPRDIAHKKRRVAASTWAMPLLVLCCLAMAASMAFGPLVAIADNPPVVPDNSSQGEQTNPTVESGDEPDNTPLEVVISSYTSESASTEMGRVSNIRLAAEAIDGCVIEPGAVFSFNEIVGDVSNDDRYQIAPVLYGDEMVYGRGGGICQVSSTLYLAALQTNLRIVERHAHSASVDYIPIGLDATISYGTMDLKLANDSEYPITIHAHGEGQSVTVRLSGQPLEEGLHIVAISSLVLAHSAGTPLPEGMDLDEDLWDFGFYIVESYREFYYHGNKIRSELLARDLYLVLHGTTVLMPDGSLDMTK